MTLYLVRHGSAGARDDGNPDDTERHLDAVGVRQAQQLATYLRQVDQALSPVTRIVSSAAARCVETVEPLADQLGLRVETADALFEGSDIETSWRLVESVEAGTVLCSHGDVIPEVIRRAKGRGMVVHGKAGCSKGSIWELDHDADGFTAGRYFPTPPV